jgi:hypothetical protein
VVLYCREEGSRTVASNLVDPGGPDVDVVTDENRPLLAALPEGLPGRERAVVLVLGRRDRVERIPEVATGEAQKPPPATIRGYKRKKSGHSSVGSAHYHDPWPGLWTEVRQPGVEPLRRDERISATFRESTPLRLDLGERGNVSQEVDVRHARTVSATRSRSCRRSSWWTGRPTTRVRSALARGKPAGSRG